MKWLVLTIWGTLFLRSVVRLKICWLHRLLTLFLEPNFYSGIRTHVLQFRKQLNSQLPTYGNVSSNATFREKKLRRKCKKKSFKRDRVSRQGASHPFQPSVPTYVSKVVVSMASELYPNPPSILPEGLQKTFILFVATATINDMELKLPRYTQFFISQRSVTIRIVGLKINLGFRIKEFFIEKLFVFHSLSVSLWVCYV